MLNQPDRGSRAGRELDPSGAVVGGEARGPARDSAAAPGRDEEPGWAAGLRKLYNSVVEEPLPDSFKDLLKKLDDSDDA